MAAAAGRWGWGVVGGFRRAATAAAPSVTACWQQPAAVRPRMAASAASAWRRMASGNAGGGGPGSEVAEAPPVGLHKPRRQSAVSPLEAMNLLGPMGAHRSTIESYNSEGFVINGTLVKGAVVILPETVMFWNVGEMKDMTWDSLSIVNVMAKKPEVCILGTGRRLQRLPPEVHLEFKKLGIHLDVMDSVNAGATFNVLNQEGRTVFAFLFPLEPVEEAKEMEEDADDMLADMPRPKRSLRARAPLGSEMKPEGGPGTGPGVGGERRPPSSMIGDVQRHPLKKG